MIIIKSKYAYFNQVLFNYYIILFIKINKENIFKEKLH
jgi:hypothetical protein